MTILSFLLLLTNRFRLLIEVLSEELGVESSLTKFGQLFATNSGGQRLLVLLLSDSDLDATASALSPDGVGLEVLMIQDVDQVAVFPRRKANIDFFFWRVEFFYFLLLKDDARRRSRVHASQVSL